MITLRHKAGLTVHCGAAEKTMSIVGFQNPDIIFMDPPFNIGVDYKNTDDAISDSGYQSKMYVWLGAAKDMMGPRSSLWLNLPDQHVAFAVNYALRDLGLTLENWCIWHYRFAVNQPNRFLRSKTHAIWLSKGDPIVNHEGALVPSDRSTMYDDIRSTGERMDFDVWGFEKYWGRVQGNNLERRPLHPNQLPEKYLERIIKVCSNAGGIVVDPFGGSGTTAVVALALKRRCLTGDICEEYCDSILKRVDEGAVRVGPNL